MKNNVFLTDLNFHAAMPQIFECFHKNGNIFDVPHNICLSMGLLPMPSCVRNIDLGSFFLLFISIPDSSI